MPEPIATIEQLVAVREARGVGAEDMIRALKLAPRQLQALEAGDWAALPGTPFVRGMLRAYARTLEVDIGPLLDTIGASVQPNELKPAGSLDEPLRSGGMLGFGGGGSGNRLVWACLVLLGVLAFALFFGRGADFSGIPSWFEERPATQVGSQAGAPAEGVAGASAGSTVEAVTLPGAGATAAQGGTTGTEASPGAAPSGPVPGAAPGSAAAVAAGAPAPGAAAAPVPAQGLPALAPAGGAPAAATEAANQVAGTLRLNFANESWVEIKQADGKVLLSGLQRASTSQALTPSGAVTMVIGNAAGVGVEYAGKPVDLKPHIRGSIARLTLP